MAAKTITGAGIVCYINNAPWAVVTAVDFRSDTPRTPHYGIDALDPFELAITRTRCTYSLAVMRTIGDGGIEGAGLVGTYESLPREKYFSIRIVDRVGGFTLFESNFCSVVSQNWKMAARGLVTGQVEIEALDWANETLV